MSEVYRSKVRYETSFDQPTDSDGTVYRTVCRQYTRWIVNGRILEPGDPAEPKLEPLFKDRPRSLIGRAVL